MFITFEGSDGCGKTTQIQKLCQRLHSEGKDVCLTREPGGNAIAEKIRQLLLDVQNEMADATECYLYAASRAEHCKNVILPALSRGEIVVCDRFLDSSIAYQGYGRELGVDFVEQVNRLAVGTCLPDRTYLLMLPRQVAEQRASQRGAQDRLESNNSLFKDRVHEGFLELAKQNSQRIIIIDATLSIEQIHKIIWTDVSKLLNISI